MALMQPRCANLVARAPRLGEGRTALNFLYWKGMAPEKRSKLLRESAKEVAKGEMPPALYTPLHPPTATPASELALFVLLLVMLTL